MTQTLTKNPFLISPPSKKKKLDINKLVLISQCFYKVMYTGTFQSLHKYTGSENCSNINIYFINTAMHQVSPQNVFVECLRCIRLVGRNARLRKKIRLNQG